MAQQVRLAKYKGPRCRDPSRMADEYVCIDEVDYSNWPVLTISSAVDTVNAITTNEVKFSPSMFLATSPLMSAFYEHYRYFRCRSVCVEYFPTNRTVDYRRTQVGIYWTPDHHALDNGVDSAIGTWQSFLEKPNTQMVNYSGGHTGFKIKYVPQMVYQEDIDEDENDPQPDTVYQVRGDFQVGWLNTNEPNKTYEYRGPLVVFRRPYSQAGGISTPEVSYAIQVKTIWEFKKAKTGN